MFVSAYVLEENMCLYILLCGQKTGRLKTSGDTGWNIFFFTEMANSSLLYLKPKLKPFGWSSYKIVYFAATTLVLIFKDCLKDIWLPVLYSLLGQLRNQLPLIMLTYRILKVQSQVPSTVWHSRSNRLKAGSIQTLHTIWKNQGGETSLPEPHKVQFICNNISKLNIHASP